MGSQAAARSGAEQIGSEPPGGEGSLCLYHPGFRAASGPQDAFRVHSYKIHSSVQLPGRASGHRLSHGAAAQRAPVTAWLSGPSVWALRRPPLCCHRAAGVIPLPPPRGKHVPALRC